MFMKQDIELWYRAGQKSLQFIRGADIAVFGAGRTVCQALKAFKYAGFSMPIVCGSKGTEDFARELGDIEIVDASALSGADYVCIDGADQIDSELNLLKGGFKGTGDPGLEGCMYREKGLAYGSSQFVVIADPSKLVEYLGQDDYRLPVEFDPSAEKEGLEFLDTLLGSDIQVRESPDGSRFMTENGKNIFDVHFDGRGRDLAALETRIGQGPTYATGLFAARRPEYVVVARQEGTEVIERD